MFSYTTKVVMLGNSAESLEIGDLPVVPADMRATVLFARMRNIARHAKLRGLLKSKPGSGWAIIWRLAVLNKVPFLVQMSLAATSAILFYGPAYFLQKLVKFLEAGPSDVRWGLVYCLGLFGVNALLFLGKRLIICKHTELTGCPGQLLASFGPFQQQHCNLDSKFN
jgi:hypothetical protein